LEKKNDADAPKWSQSHLQQHCHRWYTISLQTLCWLLNIHWAVIVLVIHSLH